MLELLRKFLRDPDFFTARLRAVLFAIGTLFAQGIVTLDILSEKLGPAGWWVGIALMIVAVAIRAGDVTPQAAKNLGQGNPAAVNSLLRSVGAEPVTDAQSKAEQKPTT